MAEDGPDFGAGRVAGGGPDFGRGSERPSTVEQKAATFAHGANTLLVRDIVGGAVDLMNQLPMIIEYIDPIDWAEKGVRSGVRQIQRKLGVEEKDLVAPFESRFSGPLTEKPFLGSKMLADVLRGTNMGYGDISEVSPDLRPYAVAGETAAGAGVAALPFFAAARIAPALSQGPPKVFDPILDFIRKRPKEAAIGEASAAALSGGGAGVAEKVFPGDPLARFFGSAGAPLLPAHLALKAAPRVARSAQQYVRQYVSRGAREDRASEKLKKMMVEFEGPGAPAETAKQLRTALGAGREGTPAQLTGSSTLTAIQRNLMEQSRKLSGDVRNTTVRAIAQGERAWAKLQEVGDVDSLVAAATARALSHVAVLEGYRDRAIELQRQAAEPILQHKEGAPGVPLKRDLSRRANDLLKQARELGNTHAKELYNKIDKGIVLDAEGLAEAYETAIADFAKGEHLPTNQHSTIAKLSKTDKDTGQLINTVTSGELLHIRKILLRQARIAGAQLEGRDNARILRDLAAGIADDLAFDAAGIDARAFYKEYADNFLRGPTARVFRSTAGERPPAEATLAMSLAGQNQREGVGFRRLREAGAFTFRNDIREAAGLQMLHAGRTTELAELQSEFLLSLAAESIDLSGDVSSSGLKTFLKNNRAAIADLGLTQFNDFDNAVSIAEKISTKIDTQKHYANQISMAAKVITNPRKEIAAALDSTNAAVRFRDLGRLARKVPEHAEAAVEGLRYALFEEIFSRLSADLMGKDLSNLLDSPVRLAVGDPGAERITLREILLREGIVTKEQSDALDAVVDQVTKLQRSMGDASALDELLGTDNDLVDLGFRLFGTQMAQRNPLSQNMGSQLVLAQRASQMSRKWFGKVPRLGTRNILIEAVNNPALMAELLERPGSMLGKKRREAAINAYLIQAGIRMAVADEETE